MVDSLDLQSFERKIHVRQLALDDFDSLIEMQEACFPGMETWQHDMVASQIALFPEGQLCVEYQGQIVACSSSLIVEFSNYTDWHQFDTISDNGYIRTHDPEGDTLYGIEMMVHPEYRGMKLARRLYDARKELVRQGNLERIIIGGRIPGYGAHASEMSAREYVEKCIAKQLFDPVLTPQLANGFVLRGLIPNYLPEDVDSAGYATHLEWTNLDYVPARQRRFYKAVKPVRMCVLQYQLRLVRTFEDFAKQVEFFVDVASDYRSDFVVFPELFTLPLMSTVGDRRPAAAARALATMTPQYLDLLTRLAVEYHVNIVGGSIFTVEDDKLFNVSYLFRRDGTLSKQYRLHIDEDEKKWWGVQPGGKVEVFDTDCGKVAILLGYDIQFPELGRIVEHEGAQIIFVPFTTDEQTSFVRLRACARARAIENEVYVVLCGAVGNLPLVQNADIHYAQSAILTPADLQFPRDGIAAESTPNIEHVMIHDVDLEMLRKRAFATTGVRHRRTDLYRIRVLRDDDSSDF